MGSYVDTTVILTSSVLTFQYLFPAGQHKHPVWVGIANQSQGTLSVQFYSNTGPGEGPTNIDAGQPFVSQEEFYMMTVTGVAGQVFNVKIQDEKLDLGKKQQVSQSLVYPVQTYAAVQTGTSTIPETTCPVGCKMTLVSVSAAAGSSSGTITIWVYRDLGLIAGTGQRFYLTPSSGTTVASSSSVTIGVEPNANIVMGSYPVLLPGDEIQAVSSLSGLNLIDVYVELIQEPL
jgi:hypothetical protein